MNDALRNRWAAVRALFCSKSHLQSWGVLLGLYKLQALLMLSAHIMNSSFNTCVWNTDCFLQTCYSVLTEGSQLHKASSHKRTAIQLNDHLSYKSFVFLFLVCIFFFGWIFKYTSKIFSAILVCLLIRFSVGRRKPGQLLLVPPYHYYQANGYSPMKDSWMMNDPWWQKSSFHDLSQNLHSQSGTFDVTSLCTEIYLVCTDIVYLVDLLSEWQ